MALTPLMQVLFVLSYYGTGSYFSVIGDALCASKDATTCIKDVVCNEIIGKMPCIIRDFGCEGCVYNAAGTNKIRKYPHALSHTVCGDHKRADILETLFLLVVFKMRIAAYQV